jgi:hypothetical protein
VLVLVLVTACGGSDDPAATSATPTRSATAKPKPSAPPPPPLTLARAKAVAAAGVLRPADLPGWQSRLMKRTAYSDTFDADIANCLGTTVPRYLTRNPGREFGKRRMGIYSTVAVARTAAEATKHITTFGTQRAARCLEDSYRRFYAEDMKVASVTFTPMRWTVPSSQRLYAYQFVVKATINGKPDDAMGYLAAAATGQAEVELQLLASPKDIPSKATFVKLLETAAARAKAASTR